MPRVNIYVRKSDWAKWQAIKNKPQWLSIAINTSLVEMAINQKKAKSDMWPEKK